jgi:hypothetical protein
VHALDAGKVLAAGEPRALLEREKAENFEELFRKRAFQK